jgi:hypothetical protein
MVASAPRLTVPAAFVLGSLFALAPVAAQPGPGPLEPPIYGQWEGPYVLVQITNEHPTNPLGEITHAIVLSDGKVLLWCRPAPEATYYADPFAHGGLWGPTHTFLWSPSDPQNVDEITVPNLANGSEDFFCNGQQLLSSGDPIVFGGTDMTQTHATGHFAVFRFDRGVRQWFRLADLTKPRWYPNAFLLGDGFLTLLGHGEAPEFYPDTPAPGEKIIEYNDRFDLSGLTWTKANNRLAGGLGDCGGSGAIKVKDYPRCFFLALRNMLLYTHLRDQKENNYMDLGVDCQGPSSGAFKYPWRIDVPAGVGCCRRPRTAGIWLGSSRLPDGSSGIFPGTSARNVGETGLQRVASNPDASRDAPPGHREQEPGPFRSTLEPEASGHRHDSAVCDRR